MLFFDAVKVRGPQAVNQAFFFFFFKLEFEL